MYRIFIIGFAFLLSCSVAPENTDKASSALEKIDVQNIKSLSEKDGLEMLTTNCFSCHNPNSASHDDMLAPPLAAIKHKYLNVYPDEEKFITEMSNFVANPSKDKAMMKGPIKRFGLMPKTALTNTEMQEIVKFIYHNEIQVPTWFPAPFEEKHNTKWDER